MKSNLQCKQLCKTYQLQGVEQPVLTDISVEFFAKQMVAIMGASGSGKSTLLNMLAGLDTPSSGEVLLMQKNYQQLSTKALSRLRNQYMGFVFQGHHLLSEFSAIENVLMPVNISGKKIQPIHKQRAGHLLEQVGLAHRLGHKPSELSGGERQRVAIARSLMNEPDVVLMDEPTGNLDEASSQQVNELIFQLNQQNSATFIIVTHNRELANSLPDRYLLTKGHLQKQSSEF
mgnify:CR=1 FL=1